MAVAKHITYLHRVIIDNLQQSLDKVTHKYVLKFHFQLQGLSIMRILK
jgi:hypothetical protein